MVRLQLVGKNAGQTDEMMATCARQAMPGEFGGSEAKQ